MLALPAAPHDWLFPRMAAVVHHGGAGTTAAGLAAGIPAVVVAHMADQPYWGRRVRDLGAGPPPLSRHRLSAGALAGAIRQAAEDDAYRGNVALLAARIREEDGPGAAVAIVRNVVG